MKKYVHSAVEVSRPETFVIFWGGFLHLRKCQSSLKTQVPYTLKIDGGSPRKRQSLKVNKGHFLLMAQKNFPPLNLCTVMTARVWCESLL